MNILAVDDERHALAALEQAIRSVAPGAAVTCHTSVHEALRYAEQSAVDVAFLDIEMDGMNGLELAKRLKEIHGGMNIIFVTGYSKYTVSAFTMHASGYVLKPIKPARIAQELEDLRFPVRTDDQGVYIRCFGSFDVFRDGLPVAFGRPKAKELLAYLVDRQGSFVSKKELAAVLWEGEAYSRSIQSHLHVLFTEMLRTLESIGAADIIIKRRGQYAVNAGLIRCDYYRYCQGDAVAVNSYRGEYMANYSWAEFTAGALTRQM